jgi:serine/threonine protein phosphatase PrpC
MKLAQSFADTNTGRKRRHNEDSFVSEPPLFAVADGMGGAQAGEVASSIAANTLLEGTAEAGKDGPARVVELIQTANRRVYQRAHEDAAASGMGTTMTVALLEADGVIVIGHVGDSRAYVLRGGRLQQLTDDHSLVAELVRRGELSPEEAEVHPQRSVITRALGTDPNVDVDAFSFQAEPGDVFLLCSDGLTSMVDVNTVAELLERNRFDLEAAARALIKAANDRGGEDNITTVLFRVGGDDEAAATVESAAISPATDQDEEDTLHPEDHVISPAAAAPVEPAPAASAPRNQTMVMSPEEIRAALRGDAPPAAGDAAEQVPEPEGPPKDALPPEPVSAEPAAAETTQTEPAPLPEQHADTPTGPPEYLADSTPRPTVSRRLLAAVVIAVLLGVIVVLMTKGLTR